MTQSFLKLDDQIMFWVNSLMGFSFVLFSSCNKGPFGNLGTSLRNIKMMMYCWMLWVTFGFHNFSYTQPLSSEIIISLLGSLLA